MKTFNFIKHPIIGLHDFVPSLLPGIEKVITIYFAQDKQNWMGHLSEQKGREYRTMSLDISGILPLIKKYTDDKQLSSWHSRQTLPFEVEVKKKNPEVDIFSEFQNVVLLIRIPDEETHLNSLVFIFLNQNPGNFGVSNSINPLTTDNKSIIAYLLRNILITEIKRQKENLAVLKSNNYKTKEVFDQVERLRNEMKTTRENYGLSLVKLCNQYVEDYTVSEDRTYSLSKGAEEKIKNYNGDLQNLESIVKNTILYLENLYFDQGGNIEIQEMHLRFTDPEGDPGKKDMKETVHHEKLGKTIIMLDKLEDAALNAKHNNLSLTGTHVGESFQIPITAPAISDALSKHRQKIRKLARLYPEKWPTIRKEFRPFKNILKEEA